MILWPRPRREALAVKCRWLGALFVVAVVFIVMLGMAWGRLR
jgi:hypothetical protein